MRPSGADAAHHKLADQDTITVPCRVELFAIPPIVPSPRPRVGLWRPDHKVTYLTTTWREILLSAIQVGRPASLWLSLFPNFAKEELQSRITPLRAYLGRDTDLRGRSVLRRSTLYRFGAEATERAAFAYRLGMTMADWLCVNRFGVAALTHLTLLSNQNPVRRASRHIKQSPDLVGRRPGSRPSLVVVEAKCGERLRLRDRQKGAWQLDEMRATGVLSTYLQILCGVSIEPHVLLLVDVVSSSTPLGQRHWLRNPAHWPGPVTWATLTPFEQFWRRLLVYRILQTSATLLRVDTTTPTPSAGTSLLSSEATYVDRFEVSRHPAEPPTQILAADVPEVGVTVGLSGRAYVEVARLAEILRDALQEQLQRLGVRIGAEGRRSLSPETLALAASRSLVLPEEVTPPRAPGEPRPPRATRAEPPPRQPPIEVEGLVAQGQELVRLRDPSVDGQWVQALDASGIYLRLNPGSFNVLD
jgi:hypothetical protein